MSSRIERMLYADCFNANYFVQNLKISIYRSHGDCLKKKNYCYIYLQSQTVLYCLIKTSNKKKTKSLFPRISFILWFSSSFKINSVY